jgi:hypothetical protein
MAEWTKLDQARADFMAAAMEYCRVRDELGDGPAADAAHYQLSEKGRDFRDLYNGQAQNVALSADRWYCPHCGAERPAFSLQLVAEVQMGVGAIQYFNVFCSEDRCRKLITVMLAGFMPEASLIEQAQQQIAGGKKRIIS